MPLLMILIGINLLITLMIQNQLMFTNARVVALRQQRLLFSMHGSIFYVSVSKQICCNINLYVNTRGNDMTHWTDEYKTMVEDCGRRPDKLSDWDNQFLNSVAEQIEEYHNLSTKQCDVLTKIWERVTKESWSRGQTGPRDSLSSWRPKDEF